MTTRGRPRPRPLQQLCRFPDAHNPEIFRPRGAARCHTVRAKVLSAIRRTIRCPGEGGRIGRGQAMSHSHSPPVPRARRSFEAKDLTTDWGEFVISLSETVVVFS